MEAVVTYRFKYQISEGVLKNIMDVSHAFVPSGQKINQAAADHPKCCCQRIWITLHRPLIHALALFIKTEYKM